jgi:hypothetical protein
VAGGVAGVVAGVERAGVALAVDADELLHSRMCVSRTGSAAARDSCDDDPADP